MSPTIEELKQSLKHVFTTAVLSQAFKIPPSSVLYYMTKLELTPLNVYGKDFWSYTAAIALGVRVAHQDPRGALEQIWAEYNM